MSGVEDDPTEDPANNEPRDPWSNGFSVRICERGVAGRANSG